MKLQDHIAALEAKLADALANGDLDGQRVIQSELLRFLNPQTAMPAWIAYLRHELAVAAGEVAQNPDDTAAAQRHAEIAATLLPLTDRGTGRIQRLRAARDKVQRRLAMQPDHPRAADYQARVAEYDASIARLDAGEDEVPGGSGVEGVTVGAPTAHLHIRGA